MKTKIKIRIRKKRTITRHSRNKMSKKKKRISAEARRLRPHATDKRRYLKGEQDNEEEREDILNGWDDGAKER